MTSGWPVAPRVRVVGTPLAYIPHGKPDAILAELGMGPHGIVETAREFVLSEPRHTINNANTTNAQPGQKAGAFS